MNFEKPAVRKHAATMLPHSAADTHTEPLKAVPGMFFSFIVDIAFSFIQIYDIQKINLLNYLWLFIVIFNV